MPDQETSAGQGQQPTADAHTTEGDALTGDDPLERAVPYGGDEVLPLRRGEGVRSEGAAFAVTYGDETVRCRLGLANADRHTGSPHRTITLRRRPDGVRVTVTDTNTDPPTSREPAEDAEGGRGLALISGIAEHFGTVVRRNSKDVWAEILTSRPAALA
ncbi:ATP-binding protein [Streptomyces microflavus]|uniref:ATP-binding protein n=1 Tax=Streptomyces microflavus TaxID=1919 RepID=UPI0033F72D6B